MLQPAPIRFIAKLLAAATVLLWLPLPQLLWSLLCVMKPQALATFQRGSSLAYLWSETAGLSLLQNWHALTRFVSLNLLSVLTAPHYASWVLSADQKAEALLCLTRASGNLSLFLYSSSLLVRVPACWHETLWAFRFCSQVSLLRSVILWYGCHATRYHPLGMQSTWSALWSMTFRFDTFPHKTGTDLSPFCTSAR